MYSTSPTSALSEDKYPHYTPIEIVDLVVHMLRELIDDDVSQEPLVAGLAAMICALGKIRLSPARHAKIDELVSMLSQILSLQRLFRSHAGIVRSACLCTLGRLALISPRSRLQSIMRKVPKFSAYSKFHNNVRLRDHGALEVPFVANTNCKCKTHKSHLCRSR